MRTTMEKAKNWGVQLLLAAVVVMCVAWIMPKSVLAADTNAPIEYLDDVYITGFFAETPDQAIHWRYSEPYKYATPYFFLPSGTDSNTVKIYFGAMDKATGINSYDRSLGYVTIDGKQYRSGDTLTLPQKSMSFTYGMGNTVEVQIQRSAKLPSIFIQTKSGSMEAIDGDAKKKTKEKGDILIMLEDGKVDYQGKLKQIKGRGNATWQLPKKPYNIKLEESSDLLGMGKSKGWCLLANYLDTALMRNWIVYNLAEETGIPFTMDVRSVDLYLNGKYAGTYMITEKVGIEKNRVNITDLGKATEKANVPLPGEEEVDLELYEAGGVNDYAIGTRKWREIPEDPADITGGYLIELELTSRYKGEACGFVTTRGQAVTLKEPEFISKAQVDYIANMYQDMEDAFYSKGGYNSKGKHFSEYIDEESIAKMYLIQEYSMNLDSGITSFYLYKESDSVGDGKLHMAPVWDFDNALGNHSGRYGVSLTDPESWWANQAPIYELEHTGFYNLLAQAVQYASVKKHIAEQWNDIFYPAVKAMLGQDSSHKLVKLKTFAEYKEDLQASAQMNFTVWPDALSHMDTGVQSGWDFEGSAEYVRDFLARRGEFMNRAFAYGSGGLGYEQLVGTVTIEGKMEIGETLTVKVTGANSGNLTYQWMADGEAIVGATDSTYVLTEQEAGKAISVAVKSSDEKIGSSIGTVSSEKVPGKEENPGPGGDDNQGGNGNQGGDDNQGGNGSQGGDNNQGGNGNQSGENPPTPGKLAASDVTKVKSTAKGVQIQFTKSEHAASYEVYRKSGSAIVKVGSTAAQVWVDTAPVGGKKASYLVKAVSSNAREYVDADYGKEGIIQLPKAPAKLKAKAVKGKKVSLSWKKVKGAKAYLIYRADKKNGTYKLTARVKKQNTVKYTDKKKLKKNKKYYYKIAVCKGGKYSPLGNAVQVKVKG